MQLIQAQQTKLALGGDVTLTLVTDDAGKADSLFRELWQYVFRFERQFSRFLPDSELSAFNRSAGVRMPISPEFRDILAAAKRLSEATDGLYNPFILPALQRAGYKQSAVPGYENDAVDDHSKKTVVDINELVIGDKWALIPYGTALDLGGCGKGYLADKLRDIADKPHIHGYWLSIGGDMAIAGHDEQRKNWTVRLQNALDPTKTHKNFIQCPLTSYAVATSGTLRRETQKSRKNWHHILDPRTQKPAITDIRLATIGGGSTLEADVLASCCVILGSKKAPAFLKKHAVTNYFLQCQDTSGPIEIISGTHFAKNRQKAVQNA